MVGQREGMDVPLQGMPGTSAGTGRGFMAEDAWARHEHRSRSRGGGLDFGSTSRQGIADGVADGGVRLQMMDSDEKTGGPRQGVSARHGTSLNGGDATRSSGGESVPGEEGGARGPGTTEGALVLIPRWKKRCWTHRQSSRIQRAWCFLAMGSGRI